MTPPCKICPHCSCQKCRERKPIAFEYYCKDCNQKQIVWDHEYDAGSIYLRCKTEGCGEQMRRME